MSEIMSTIGKAIGGAMIVATEFTASTVSLACKVAPDIGKATCDAAQAGSEAIGEAVKMVANKK